MHLSDSSYQAGPGVMVPYLQLLTTPGFAYAISSLQTET